MENSNPYGNKFLPYLREDRLPHIFCPGCGNGTIMNAFIKGMEKAEMDFDSVAMVSGIGCSSRIPGYMDCDSLHTTHGRALSFATGLKVSNPDLNVVVFSGDGDAASIGGNHLIHAARRNINLTVICVNNNIYGMTGGQISPTSPKGSFGTTAPYGTDDSPFKLAELVAAAGATYSARWTTLQIENLVGSIKTGLKNKGFSFIEVVSPCPTYYGRKNKLRTPTAMAVTIKINTVFKSEAERMKEKDLEGKIVVGEFANKTKAEFTDNIQNLSERLSGDKTLINSAYRADL
ncbi:2-oxoglutarate oxidoreductase subunit KorB [Methanobrevibacter woesei]|jgi:2-oxoglutarate ferredoxin oxidoreductase subunit beta|uniref:2-oxoglutarate oxidoreductase subunit KorB n=1 Tax=Methanobrevibacter woesei TaxID=190976 RepID=A0A2U1S749_9EURY|nr:2-oxoacid:ferredoxin oxidoreductase subunit beta [Methanobrevibacter woesei]MCC9260831.1 2-oxoacid:ferredoxin oxidoreductase subunit beta [Methanobrevibacter woesei]MCI7291671.1 2-oxoacid:ferredoxin oxidoreductase subunit beta [Methanobrevibacter woesei]PWB85902.1 2-oxoglutarate oxidoreductase subunit KorB [Methanobrevibacter woesei]